MIKDETSNSMTLFDVFFMYTWRLSELINIEHIRFHIQNEAKIMMRKRTKIKTMSMTKHLYL